MSDTHSDSWEVRLKTRLTEHRVSDPDTVVTRWKKYRETALAQLVKDLRTQLRTAQADTGPSADSRTAYGSDTALDQHIPSAISSIHSRIADAESRLLTVARAAGNLVESLECTQGDLEKSLAVLRDRLPKPGKSQQLSAGGLSTVIGFGAVLAVVVVALVLALSWMLRSVSP